MKSQEDVQRQEINTLLSQNHQTEKATQMSLSSILHSKRFVVCALLFFGHIVLSMGSHVIDIAVIEMISKRHLNSSTDGYLAHTSHASLNEVLFGSPKYQWDTITVGMILNMFWYGMSLSPIGGSIAHKFGGATTIGITMMLTAVVLLLTPASLYVHFYLFLTFRGLTGLFEGFSCASCAPIFAHWIPKHERPTFVSSIVNGFYLGSAITCILFGFIVHHWGWPMSFYTAGITCFVWSLLWLLLVTNSPSEDRRISKKELAYIKEGTGNISSTTKNNHPYKAILLSPPFWALTLCKFAYGWGTGFVIGYCPMYITDITQHNIKIVGYLSSIPNLVNLFLIPFGGIMLSYGQKRTKLQDNQIHKIILCAGFLICAVLFVLMIVFANYFIVSMICIVLINLVISYDRILYELITVNMAPNHSSLISGMSLFGQPAGTILAQISIGYLVQNHNVNEWNISFLWTAVILVLVALVYLIFGSSEQQPWSMPSADDCDKHFRDINIRDEQ